MKNYFNFFCVLFLIFNSIVLVYSETPEQRLLRMKEQKIKTYLYQAKVGDRNQKIDVLDKILNEFDEFSYSI